MLYTTHFKYFSASEDITDLQKFHMLYFIKISHFLMTFNEKYLISFFVRKRITYCLPMYSVRDSMLPLPFSSVEDERKHMLLLHCPLSSEYVQGAELSFSFLVDTAIKKQNTIISGVTKNTESFLQFYNAY